MKVMRTTAGINSLKPLTFLWTTMSLPILPRWSNGIHWCSLLPLYLPGDVTERAAQWPVQNIFPKGKFLEKYSNVDVLSTAEQLYVQSHRKLIHRTPEKIFGEFLGLILAT